MGGFTYVPCRCDSGKENTCGITWERPPPPYGRGHRLLLKSCGACLRYQVHPRDYIFHNEERRAHFPGAQDTLRLKELASLEV